MKTKTLDSSETNENFVDRKQHCCSGDWLGQLRRFFLGKLIRLYVHTH